MLLSINPEHVDNIVSGAKRYEFRKVRRRSDVNRIVIYATAPRKEAIGEVVIEAIIEDDVVNVRHLTKRAAGITYEFFQAYYKGKKKAIAYKLGELELFDEPKRLEDYGVRYAPQSFAYLDPTT
ncbi:MAG: ASCH domain-containing protein [Clostridiales Family XIII bacterium]|jgi:predicted transcriptional regulator|nr:ASCH domain-containing protein [Clostridiales Family XIII bacterium]